MVDFDALRETAARLKDEHSRARARVREEKDALAAAKELDRIQDERLELAEELLFQGEEVVGVGELGAGDEQVFNALIQPFILAHPPTQPKGISRIATAPDGGQSGIMQR